MLTDFCDPIAPVCQPEPTPISPSSSQAQAWKTYTNSEFGYSFEYPADWKILEDEYGDYTFYSTIRFLEEEADGVFHGSLLTINVLQPGDEHFDITDSAKRMFPKVKFVKPEDDVVGDFEDYVDIDLGGKTALLYDNQAGLFYGYTSVSWLTSTKAVVIESAGPYGLREDLPLLGNPPYGDHPIFQHIVSSFVFL